MHERPVLLLACSAQSIFAECKDSLAVTPYQNRTFECVYLLQSETSLGKLTVSRNPEYDCVTIVNQE